MQNRSDVSCFAHQINNRPVFFALLQVINPQANGFMPSQSTRQQQRKKCSVPLSFETLAIWHLPKRVSLLDRQPVSKANTQFLHTFDAANASREIRTEQTEIGCFVRESPHSAQAQIDSSRSQ